MPVQIKNGYEEREFKMNSFKKKVTALILIVATIALVVPYHEFTQVYASSYVKEAKKMDAYDYTSSPALAAKLKQVFEGNIGLYTSSSFSKQVKAPLGCSKLTGRNHYYIKANSTGSTNNGWQCYIYANAVYNTLYNEWVGRAGSLKNSKVVISGGKTFSYKQFVKAGVKVGAYARTTGNKNGSYSGSVAHSFVILGYNEENVTYIEGNADGRGLVRVTKSTWGELNKAQTSGRGRYICHVVQPTDKYYESLYGSKKASSGSASASKKTETNTSAKSSTTVNPTSVKVKFSRTLSYTKNKKVLSGSDVLYMQTSLKFLGYSVSTNSKYDSSTASAVKKFQKDKKLTADGKIGKGTWAAIEKAVSAKNSVKKVTVTFNANGGKNAPANQTVESGKATALTKSLPARSGYIFLGWAKSKTAAKADYKAGEKITVKEDTTLYAVWEEEEMNITAQPVNAKGSSGSKVTFSVKASGLDLHYQWYYKKPDNSDWILWEGHDTASTTGTANGTWAGMKVYCVVTNGKGESVSSETATFTLA